MSARINPSILSADFVNFERDFGTIANCDLIHVDVMDNNFVPNLTFGLPMVARMQQITPKPLDIHLMIANVDKWAAGYAETGAYSVTFHAEASDNPWHSQEHCALLVLVPESQSSQAQTSSHSSKCFTSLTSCWL